MIKKEGLIARNGLLTILLLMDFIAIYEIPMGESINDLGVLGVFLYIISISLVYKFILNIFKYRRYLRYVASKAPERRITAYRERWARKLEEL